MEITRYTQEILQYLFHTGMICLLHIHFSIFRPYALEFLRFTEIISKFTESYLYGVVMLLMFSVFVNSRHIVYKLRKVLA